MNLKNCEVEEWKKWKVHFIIEEFPWVWTTPSSKAQLHKNLCIVNKKELVEVEEFFALMSVQVFFLISILLV